MPFEKMIVNRFIKKHLTLSIAESCTGGLLSHRLTNIPGSSKVLKASLVAYSNEAKTKMLKVPASLIKKYGAVSSAVAIAMAKGARKIFKTDFGVAITGIAGPTGATHNKPIGLTLIAIATAQKIACQRFIFKGTRLQIKIRAAKKTLKLLDDLTA